jgi:hypothetical protein
MHADAWSEDEVRAVIDDYFEMFRCEMDGLAFNKAEHNRMLRDHLNDRTRGSVELKHQNISAVLTDLGLPFLPGYKPKHNYQQLLKEYVETHLAEHPELRQKLERWAAARTGRPKIIPLMITGGLGVLFGAVG